MPENKKEVSHSDDEDEGRCLTSIFECALIGYRFWCIFYCKINVYTTHLINSNAVVCARPPIRLFCVASTRNAIKNANDALRWPCSVQGHWTELRTTNVFAFEAHKCQLPNFKHTGVNSIYKQSGIVVGIFCVFDSHLVYREMCNLLFLESIFKVAADFEFLWIWIRRQASVIFFSPSSHLAWNVRW